MFWLLAVLATPSLGIHCLRVLWSEQAGLDNLFKTLPPQTWQYHEQELGVDDWEDLPFVSRFLFDSRS